MLCRVVMESHDGGVSVCIFMAKKRGPLVTATCFYVLQGLPDPCMSNREWRSSPNVVALVSSPLKGDEAVYIITVDMCDLSSRMGVRVLRGLGWRSDGKRPSAQSDKSK